jgi:hypothetical protein
LLLSRVKNGKIRENFMEKIENLEFSREIRKNHFHSILYIF